MIYKELDDVIECLIDYRGKTPKKSSSGIKMLSAKTVKMGYIDYANTYYISKEEYKKFAVRGKIQKGDILVTTEAPLGCVAKLTRDDVGIAQRLLAIRGKKGVLDNDYLMYFLMSKKGQHELFSRETGTTVTGIKQSEIRKIKIPVPDIKVQKKLSKILTIIDLKIEENNHRNNNLYDLASKLYEEKFITCRNEEWDEYKLIDIADIVNGYSYKGTELVNDSSIGMATIKNFDRNGGFKEDGFKPLNPNKVKNSQYIEKFDVVVACTDLTQNADIIGNANLLLSKEKYEKIIISMDLVKIVPNSDIIDNFMIYSILNSQEFKKFALGYTSGTTVLHLNKNCFKDYIIKLPGKNEIDSFIETIKPIYIKISQIMEENKVLEKLRDTLLPKLMNGEIDLENIEI